jgi:heme/copper-type cytochrome/quinol oxidase subunit 2
MKSKMNVSQNIYTLLVMMTLIVYVLVFVLFYRMFIARKKSKTMNDDTEK